MITPGEESITIPAYTDKELTVEAIADNFFDLTKFGYTKAAAGTVTYAESGGKEINIIHHLGTPIKMLIMELTDEPEFAGFQEKWVSLMLKVEMREGANGNRFYGGGQVAAGGSSPPVTYDDEKAAAVDATNDSDRFYTILVQAGLASCYFETGTYRWLVLA